jgi:hypothetical protein
MQIRNTTEALHTVSEGYFTNVLTKAQLEKGSDARDARGLLNAAPTEPVDIN